MRILWTYELPKQGNDAPGSSEAPLCWDGQAVLVPISNFEHGRDRRAKDMLARGYRFDVHRVRADGNGTLTSFRTSSMLTPQSWSFLRIGDELVLHVGTFHTLPGNEASLGMSCVNASDGAGRGIFIQHGGYLVFADSETNCVHCYDTDRKACNWTLDLRNTHRYRVGPVAIYHDQVVCHGRDALNYIDLATGHIERQQAFPRIDKLYPPLEYEGDLLFAYTNWTSGGLIRFDPKENKVRWKFKTRGRTAIPRGGPLPVAGKTAILSLNDGSSLVGVDLDNGSVRWTYRAQWLHTAIEVCGPSMIFGTSGGYGRHLRRHQAETGETEWAVEMDGGCPYYSTQGDYLVAGDWGGVLRRIRRTDGEVVEKLSLGAPVTTEPLVVDTDIFLLKWPTDGNSPALVAVGT